MSERIIAAGIARRVRGGGNPAESEALLRELVAEFAPQNLGYALHYNGFATERGAERLAAALLAREEVAV